MATVRVYTKTAGIGMQLSRIGEQLPCTREPGHGNSKDPFAVAVVRSSVTVSQQLRTIVNVGPHYLRAAAASDWAWLTRILHPRKLFPRNFVKGQSAKILSLENLALYGMESNNPKSTSVYTATT